ncbi:MAG: tetratricopeptide repeat protein [Verrucomicrobia bacterium]|nr:tetratricopeptide repeat protein [Verrucomicrobiota bacterium]
MKSALPRLLALAALALAAATGSSVDPPAKLTADQAPPAQWPALAAAGDPLAQALLARAYLLGTDGMAENPKAAALWAHRSAGKQHPLGLFLRGYARYRDFTRPKAERREAAKPFFEQAVAAGFATLAEQGGRQWLALLGDVHDSGWGVPTNSGEAVKCWRKAAGSGDPFAMYRIGLVYLEGEGVPRDGKTALRWFRKAAAAGEANAMAGIGYCYDFGNGLVKDMAAAVEWYRKAADRGNATAMFHLGLSYIAGQGVPKDEAEGVKWLHKAADVGDPTFMQALGDCYKDGVGVPADKEEAAKWYRKAAASGDEAAKDALEKLEAAE